MSVQRWKFLYPQPYEDGSGEWVRYTDHERALAEERATALMDARCGDSASTVCACYHRGKADAEQPPWMAMFGAAAQPRILTADDPEPAVGSVVLDEYGAAWQRNGGWVCVDFPGSWPWRGVLMAGPLRLIHDGGRP